MNEQNHHRIDHHATESAPATAARLILIIGLSCIQLRSATAADAVLNVPEMLAQQDQWNEWAGAGRRIDLSGRYEGRTGQAFRLNRLPLSIVTPRTNPLPDRMQQGQRITVSGQLRNQNGRPTLEVNRLSIGGTDLDELVDRVGQLADASPDALYELAGEYVPAAEFYQDEPLHGQIRAVRETAFRKQRATFRSDAAALWSLADSARTRGVSETLAAEVRFEALVSRWRQPDENPAVLRQVVQEHAPGWDVPNNGWDERREAAFLADPTGAYGAATVQDRPMFHRRLYRAVVCQQLERQLKGDGSNGVELAATLREALPEDDAVARRLEAAEIKFQLNRVEQLSRSELLRLADLLKRHAAASEIPAAVDRWVRGKTKQFSSSGAPGLVRAADEHLFLVDRFQLPEYQQAAIDLLKQAWSSAHADSATDAAQIAERLGRLGWERVQDRWMSRSEVQSLPEGSVQRAMREGRVVKGMTGEQVVGTLGQPTRISRIVSARSIRELWVYDTPGSVGLVVQLRRPPTTSAGAALVSEVSRSTGR